MTVKWGSKDIMFKVKKFKKLTLLKNCALEINFVSALSLFVLSAFLFGIITAAGGLSFL